MTTKQFIQQLAKAAESGYRFSLGEGINLGPDGKRRPKWMLRCNKIPRKKLRWGCMPVEAVCYYVTGEMPDGHVLWINACERLGLTVNQGGLLMRAGDQIVCYDKGAKKPRVKYSVRLRRDMLEACNLQEKC